MKGSPIEIRQVSNGVMVAESQSDKDVLSDDEIYVFNDPGKLYKFLNDWFDLDLQEREKEFEETIECLKAGKMRV